MRSTHIRGSLVVFLLAALALLIASGPARTQSSCQNMLNEVIDLSKRTNEVKDKMDKQIRCSKVDVELRRQWIRMQERLILVSRRYVACDASHEVPFTRVYEKNLQITQGILASCK